MNVISFNSSRYFTLSLKTGPITILIPCSYNSFEDLKAFIGFDLVSLGIISILLSSILLIANLTDLIIELPSLESFPLIGTIRPILIFSLENCSEKK